MKTSTSCSHEPVIRDVTSRIFATGKISREDERALHQVMVSDMYLDTGDVDQIRGVLDRLQMGLIKVADYNTPDSF